MKILFVNEEYGYNTWYAIISDERYEEIKSEWQTIKGLNCLVPVRFLFPEAKNLPLYPEDQKYADKEYLAQNNIEIIDCHVHQSDDSFLAGINYEIPEQKRFEFKGKIYSEEEVYKILDEYRTKDQETYDERYASTPELFERGVVSPTAWNVIDGIGEEIEFLQ